MSAVLYISGDDMLHYHPQDLRNAAWFGILDNSFSVKPTITLVSAIECIIIRDGKQKIIRVYVSRHVCSQ